VADRLAGRKIAFLTANEGVEEIEMTEPRRAVEDAGGAVELLAPETGDIQTFNHLDKSSVYQADRAVADAFPGDYDGLVLPGGVANPDALRQDDDAVRFVRDFVTSGKPVAVICHGPWTLVEAGVLDGRSLTSWPSLQTDIRNAGGEWSDQEVVVDGNLISSRKPDDLPAFCRTVVDHFADGHA
jgi:protease I